MCASRRIVRIMNFARAHAPVARRGRTHVNARPRPANGRHTRPGRGLPTGSGRIAEIDPAAALSARDKSSPITLRRCCRFSASYGNITHGRHTHTRAVRYGSVFDGPRTSLSGREAARF